VENQYSSEVLRVLSLGISTNKSNHQKQLLFKVLETELTLVVVMMPVNLWKAPEPLCAQRDA
jgi:hypothetical protein